jgi:transcriptional regulator with GAF, ATPase, and Fis domain
LANNSTLFLDEIGEMAPDLQVKLLRAIQEKEIERIGGKAVIKTDVRIIAATNRNLQKEVEAGRFRNDLYYRLDVFPIVLPPLRERKEDIPLLVAHFIDRLARKSGKKITNISSKALQEMAAYDWPGNIRELEHIIERSVLMAQGTTIKEIYLQKTGKESISADLCIKTLEQNERDHVIAALKKCNGRIRGAGGAAELLNVPPTTLHSKIKKLKIKKSHE